MRNSFEREFENQKRNEIKISKMMRKNSSMKDYKILQQKMNLRIL